MTTTTESSSRYDDLEKMSIRKLLVSINQEDAAVPLAIRKVIPEMERLIKVIVSKMSRGGVCSILERAPAAGWV